MPISTLIASGTTAATSADTTLVDGAVATLVLTGDGTIFVEAKTVAGAYITVQSLTTKTPVQKVYGPLVFRARREVVRETFAPGGIAPTVPPVGIEAYTDTPMGGSGAPLAVTGPVTNTELRASPVPVDPNVTRGSGAVDANTQRVTLAADGPGVASLSSINAKTPALVGGASPTIDAQGGTRYYDWAQNKRAAVGSTSSAADTIPSLYASREMMAHASVRCFVRFGGSGVSAASAGANQLIVEAGERFHFRVNAGDTHFRVIRDTADGHLSLTAVIA